MCPPQSLRLTDIGSLCSIVTTYGSCQVGNELVLVQEHMELGSLSELGVANIRGVDFEQVLRSFFLALAHSRLACIQSTFKGQWALSLSVGSELDWYLHGPPIVSDPAHAVYSARQSPAQVLAVAASICLGCCYLHEAEPPLVACLSPQHIMFDGNLSAKLRISPATLKSAAAIPVPPQPTAMGLWTAPECVRGFARSQASDVYAFGMLLYELCVGAEVFQARGRAG